MSSLKLKRYVGSKKYGNASFLLVGMLSIYFLFINVMIGEIFQGETIVTDSLHITRMTEFSIFVYINTKNRKKECCPLLRKQSTILIIIMIPLSKNIQVDMNIMSAFWSTSRSSIYIISSSVIHLPYANDIIFSEIFS